MVTTTLELLTMETLFARIHRTLRATETFRQISALKSTKDWLRALEHRSSWDFRLWFGDWVGWIRAVLLTDYLSDCLVDYFGQMPGLGLSLTAVDSGLLSPLIPGQTKFSWFLLAPDGNSVAGTGVILPYTSSGMYALPSPHPPKNPPIPLQF